MSSTTYARDEIISVSELQKSLKKFLDFLKSGKKEKIAVSRNNKIEAILVPVEEYEYFESLEEKEEYEEILKIVEERRNKKATVTLEDIKKEYNL